MLERLEERLNPSPLIEFAANATQLQTDLTNATAPNTQYYIVLTGGSSAFHLASGQELTVGAAASGSSVKIVGLGQKITGNGNRVFAVEPGAVVTLDYLTITGGSVTQTNSGSTFDVGGGLLNSGGSVTLNRVTVRGNLVKGDFAEGGGIYTVNGGSLTIQGGSTIESNSALGTQTSGFGGGGFAAGGGLYKSGGSVTINRATVKDNHVKGDSALGGGIFTFNGGNLTIQGGSTIESNSAVGLGTNGRGAAGGGILVSSLFSFSPGNLQILDSTVRNNIAQGAAAANGATPGASGGAAASAVGGGLDVTGAGWVAKLIGDTFSGNEALGGNGGNGAAGSNATTPNTTGGNGGYGGAAGSAVGGACEFALGSPFNPSASASLTILCDAAHPSIFFDNTAQAGIAGNGGAGGQSTGTASNSNGGGGGSAGIARGGAMDVETNGSLCTVSIGNTTFYGNAVTGGNGGAGGAAGTGGSGAAGMAGARPPAGYAYGGAVQLFNQGNVTMVNNTIAKNSATAVLGTGGQTQISAASGGGLFVASFGHFTFDNNTITQNVVSGTNQSSASGIALVENTPASFTNFYNNLIQSNHSSDSTVPDLYAPFFSTTLANATNNFISTVSPDSINTSTNIVGNPQPQLGNVVGVNSKGEPTGGPIYYPLLPDTVSIGAGTTSVLSTIAAVEGVPTADATDEIGNPRSNNNTIDLGAVQFVPKRHD